MTELIHRPRRLRRTAALREMLRETRLNPSNLIYPLFACPGEECAAKSNLCPECSTSRSTSSSKVRRCPARGRFLDNRFRTA